MNILLKSAKIIDANSSYHKQIKDMCDDISLLPSLIQEVLSDKNACLDVAQDYFESST